MSTGPAECPNCGASEVDDAGKCAYCGREGRASPDGQGLHLSRGEEAQVRKGFLAVWTVVLIVILVSAIVPPP